MRQRVFNFRIGIVLAAMGIFAEAPPGTPAAKPANPVAEAARLNNLGAAYMNQQLFEKGLKAFQDAAALDPQLKIARLNQGIALLNLARVETAKQFLEEAVKRDPNDPHAWFNLGLLYKNSDRTADAVDAFRHVIEIDAHDADARYFLGAAYLQIKQYRQAIEAFEQALKLNPLHASAEFGLSRAYQQSDDLTAAREHLQRFQYVTQRKLGAPISLAYGEQGKYSLVEESPAFVERVPAQIPVKFVDVTGQAGLITKADPSASDDLAPDLGSGACFLDYDHDGKLDIFLADNGAQGGMSLYHNLGNGKFEEVTKKAGLDPALRALGCTAGDYDNDGATDLAVSFKQRVLLLHNQNNGTFKDVTEAAGIRSPVMRDPNFPAFHVGLTFIDYDHDGDLDLYITRFLDQPQLDAQQSYGMGTGVTGWNSMWRNNGNGTFTDVTDSVGLRGATPSLGAIGTDYNNDRAVDLAVTGWGAEIAAVKSPLTSGTSVYENPREGKFVKRELWSSPLPAMTAGLGILDFDHDGWMDMAFTHWDGRGVTLWRNNRGKSFDQVALPSTNWVRGFGVAAFDYDNDGWVDLVAVGQTRDGKGEVRLFRNLGPEGFKEVTAEVGLDQIQLKDPRAIIIGDFDNDGATDLLITQKHGPAVLLKNEGGNKNNWLRLALKGLNDNKSAIGTKIELFSDGIRQKFEITGSNGYLGQNSPYLTVGLGQAKAADIVRLLWPTGVLQDEIEVAGKREQAFTEIDRRGSSCPTLFVWDGRHYQLVNDMIGAGVVGHWVGPGPRNIPRPTEYVKIDRRVMREKNGKLSLRFMEPLEEVVYLDQVRLLAVDHPAVLEVYPNEYFASHPPFPPFKVVASRDAGPPAGAWDEHGHNLLPDLLAQRYVGDFELLSFKGFSKLHSLELDLGEPYYGGPLWLLLHGEIEYFTATAMYAADQAGIQAIPPYVEARDAQGKWIRVIDDMGFPAGGPRTMTADLTNRLPRGTQRIRIWTNLQIYWNSILIDRAAQKQNVRLTPLPLERADLRFHGFPRKIEGQPPGNVQYVYEKASPTGPYTRSAGTYTRYGDVRPLLISRDDQFAVFGSGDEVALDFDPSKLPALPKHWVRDYLFQANGYEKDRDFYAAEGNTVEPLPFRRMGMYPYPADQSFPLDDVHLNYLLNYNTRYLSGNEPRAYRYDFSPPK